MKLLFLKACCIGRDRRGVKVVCVIGILYTYIHREKGLKSCVIAFYPSGGKGDMKILIDAFSRIGRKSVILFLFNAFDRERVLLPV